jgi:hypothetical protein
VEHDAAAAAAWALGLPLREVLSRAEEAGRLVRVDPRRASVLDEHQEYDGAQVGAEVGAAEPASGAAESATALLKPARFRRKRP